MLANPLSVTVLGIPGKLNAVFTGAEVVTVTNKTIREGLGQEPGAVLISVGRQLGAAVITPAVLSQEQAFVAVAVRLVTFGASSLAA